MTRLAPSFSPDKRLDVQQFARLGHVWEADFPTAQLPRVAASVASGDPMRCKVIGGLDTLKRPILRVSVSGQLRLVCQRCLGDVPHSVESESTILLARSNDELEAWDSEAFEVLGPEDHVTPRELAEDEVLLALPFAPMCEAACGPRNK